MREYAIRIGGSIWNGDYSDDETRFLTYDSAKAAMEAMEEADKVYDIPNPPKRTVVCREVEYTPWKKARTKGGKPLKPYRRLNHERFSKDGGDLARATWQYETDERIPFDYWLYSLYEPGEDK